MRVLWLTKGLGVGGLERILCWWAESFDQHVLEPSVAHVLHGLDALAPELQEHGVNVTGLGALHELDLRWVARLRRLLIDHPVDIVHSHSPYAAAFARLLVRSMPQASRPKLVCTDHNVWRDYHLATRLAHFLTCSLDDAHFAVSRTVRESIPSLHRSHVEVLVPGIPLHSGTRTENRDRIRRELGVGDDEILVITLANFRPAKRYGDLAAAARTVLDAGCPVKFVAVGEGPLQWDVLRLVAELGITDRFRLIGLREDAAPLLAGADLFVLASDHEGGPLAILEAMAAGLPVVSTPVGLVPDAVAEGVTGRIVPVGRPDELATAIIDLVGDPVRRAAMGAAARTRVLDFGVVAPLRALEDRYLTLVGRARALPPMEIDPV